MSVKERRRLVVLSQVQARQLSLRQAAGALALSYRQTRRCYQRFRPKGAAGLVHGLRGQAGNHRRDPAVRRRAVALYRQHDGDFGSTLACEYLAQRHGLRVDDQTLRRWLAAAGLWPRRRRGHSKHQRRARRPCLGELVPMDGSTHDGLAGRGPVCTLMVMIDDATSLLHARFFPAQTTVAAMTLLRQWALA